MQAWVVSPPSAAVLLRCCTAIPYPLLFYLLLLSPTLSSAAEDNIWQGPALPCACPLPPPASATQVPRSTENVCLFSHRAFFIFVSFFPTVAFLMSWKSACRQVLLKWRPTEICFNILSGSFFLFQRDHKKLFEQMISSVVLASPKTQNQRILKLDIVSQI